MIRTVSLETAEKLKEAGFRQDATFARDLDGNITANPGNKLNDYWYASPSACELLDELPGSVDILTLNVEAWNMKIPYELTIKRISKTIYEVKYISASGIQARSYENEYLCEALASMWLHLNNQGKKGSSDA